MTAEEGSSPLARVIFLRSFIPGMLILMIFAVLTGNIIFNAIQASFRDHLHSSQKLFVDTISPDLLMGANAAVYGRCQLYKTTQPVDSMELLDLSGRPLCGPWDPSRKSGVLIETPIYFDETGQEQASVLRVRYSTSLLGAAKLKYGILLFIAIFGLGAIHFIVARVISSSVSAPIAEVSRLLGTGDVGAIIRSEGPSSPIQEVGTLRSSMKVLAARIVEYQNELVAGARREAAARMAAQVAHDIRSPLAALDSVLKDIAQIPEEKRSLLRSASSRIRDIAESLLEKNRSSRAEGRTLAETPPSPVEPLLDSVIEEKRLVLPKNVELVVNHEEGARAIFAVVDTGAFKRVLSNLLNNAIEALNGGGRITVSLSTDAQMLRLTVKDDGKGVPPDVLARLGERGMSWGKPGGSGLGLSHARAFADAHGGRLEISSEVGKGTSASVILPSRAAPPWFVSEIVVAEGGRVLILDDDPGVHAIWEGRFAVAKKAGISLEHFSGPDQLREWARTRPDLARKSLCLFDYELYPHKTTGLALARELDLLAQTILVTGRADDLAIIADCAESGVRLLPKSEAGRAPLRMARAESRSDCILVDDDELVIKVWQLAAKRAGKTLSTFRTARECLDAAATLDRDTTVYLDSHLGQGETGEELALQLHASGFRRIYLATGRENVDLGSLPWLTGVIGKEPPWG